jgi:polar amino acid transport system substrate-binding protein
LLEIVQELLRRTDTDASIEFVPWRRAQLMSSTQARTAIFPLTRTAEREAHYRWLVQLYHEQFVFLSIEGRPFDVRAPERHKERRIGMLRGSAMIATVRQLGYRNVVEASSVDEGMRYLKRGIVDAVFGDRALLQYALQGRLPDKYVTSAPLRSSITWLGGARDFSDADAAQFQKAMKAMNEDGSTARILRKYHLPAGPETLPPRK